MSDRLRRSALGSLLLLALLGAAWLVPLDPVTLTDADVPGLDEWGSALDGLPDDATILVGFDPDLGTYAEIRPAVRTALADLLARDARLAFVSLTPEGRALLLAELERLGRNQANAARILDLGFLPGAEAALVSLTKDVVVDDPAGGSLGRRLADEGLEAVDAALVVGGNDFGPRSWVEQVLPRVDDLVLLAITPTVLLPEVLPYLESGQLDGLLATPLAGAAYRDAVALGGLERLAEPREPRDLPLLLGIGTAIAALAHALLRRARGGRPVAGDAA